MDELFEKALEIKRLEKQKFEELHSLTHNTIFQGKQEDIEIYSEYIDNRQVIIDEIDRLNVAYNKIKALLEPSMPQYNKILNIEQDIKIIINSIKQIDHKNNIILTSLKDSLSQEMAKSLKRLNVSTKYLSTAENINSIFFDRRN